MTKKLAGALIAPHDASNSCTRMDSQLIKTLLFALSA